MPPSYGGDCGIRGVRTVRPVSSLIGSATVLARHRHEPGGAGFLVGDTAHVTAL
ncbi:MAG: hypothetical protein H7233_04070 [Pseudorhodobacter sp.]|nr:hypothetical protein [Frankiaceae bacterium]